MLWASHLIDEIAAGDRLIVLHQGKVRASGGVDEILTQTGAASIGEAFARLTGAGS